VKRSDLDQPAGCVTGVDLNILARVAREHPRLMATKSAIARTQAILQRNDTAQK